MSIAKTSYNHPSLTFDEHVIALSNSVFHRPTAHEDWSVIGSDLVSFITDGEKLRSREKVDLPKNTEPVTDRARLRTLDALWSGSVPMTTPSPCPLTTSHLPPSSMFYVVSNAAFYTYSSKDLAA